LDLAVQDGRVFVLHEIELAVSADAGATWVRNKVPLDPKSVFFLDANLGWIVTAEGLFHTEDGAHRWHRILKSRDLLRCWFLSASHGYAVGNRKTALETLDGGKNWRPLEAATGVLSDAERTSFTGIEFSGRTGFISGYHSPKRPPQAPNSATPDASVRQWPQLGILIQTVDGGETWKPSSSAIFGRMAQARVSGRSAALLLQFDYEFQWPSEVYRIDLPTGETMREYRDAGRRVCAVLPIGGTVAVAAIRLSEDRQSFPRPLELQVDQTPVPIDERLTASKCYLARDGEKLWLATDQGFVETVALP